MSALRRLPCAAAAWSRHVSPIASATVGKDRVRVMPHHRQAAPQSQAAGEETVDGKLRTSVTALPVAQGSCVLRISSCLVVPVQLRVGPVGFWLQGAPQRTPMRYEEVAQQEGER
jgi:hypothetical protein